MKKKILLVLMVFLLNWSAVYSHSGGLDSQGGHNNTKEGNYHYHRGTYAGWTTSSKEDIPNSSYEFDPNLITDNIPDTTASTWAYTELNLAYHAGLFRGVRNTYSSEFTSNITREEFCKLIINAVTLKDDEYENKYIRESCAFKDLNTYNYSVNIAYRLGIVNGYDNISFKPTKEITREEMACMIYRYMDLYGEFPLMGYILIHDEDLISTWAYDEVNVLVTMGIIKGISETELIFSPQTYTTVEQAILLVYRTLE